MRNKIKFVIFGGIFSLLLLPMVTSAGVSLTVDKQASANWFYVDVASCVVTTTFPVPPGKLTPLPSCSYGATDLQKMIQDDLHVTPNVYWFTITAKDNFLGNAVSASDYLEVLALKPTTAPTLTVNPSSGLSNASFTLSWTAGNNTPTFYNLNLYSDKNKTTSNPTGADSKNPSGVGNVTSFVVTSSDDLWGVTNSADIYGFAVQACNTGGCGPWSTQKTYTAATAASNPTVNVNLGFLDKVKSSIKNTFSYIKRLNITEKAFAYTSK